MQTDAMGSIVFKDREIMRRTVMRGQSTVFGSEAIDSMRLLLNPVAKAGESATTIQPPAKRSKVCRSTVKLPQWKAVMQAGLDQFRVGVYDDGRDNADKKGARVVFDIPPPNDKLKETEYHNRLMKLCGVSFYDFSQAVTERQRRTGTSSNRST